MSPSERAAHIQSIVAAAPPLDDHQASIVRSAFGAGPRAALDKVAPPPVSRTAIYRYFDADDNLLYVGITGDPLARDRSHSRRSAFQEFTARQSVEWLPSRAAALEAESSAISSEQPLFNRVGSDPDRDSRLARYLIARDAFHLLRIG